MARVKQDCGMCIMLRGDTPKAPKPTKLQKLDLNPKLGARVPISKKRAK